MAKVANCSMMAIRQTLGMMRLTLAFRQNLPGRECDAVLFGGDWMKRNLAASVRAKLLNSAKAAKSITQVFTQLPQACLLLLNLGLVQ